MTLRELICMGLDRTDFLPRRGIFCINRRVLRLPGPGRKRLARTSIGEWEAT